MDIQVLERIANDGRPWNQFVEDQDQRDQVDHLHLNFNESQNMIINDWQRWLPGGPAIPLTPGIPGVP